MASPIGLRSRFQPRLNHHKLAPKRCQNPPLFNPLRGVVYPPFTGSITPNIGGSITAVSDNVTYTLDAAGNLTSDGLRDFEYDEANRLSKVKLFKDGEAAKVRYLTNALGRRVFKGEPETEQTLPNETELGVDFITWLKSNFKWLFATAQANTSIGTGYMYADSPLPTWAILGEYDNGSAAGKGRTEYLWLPTDDGSAIPVGIFRNGKLFAIHTDHVGTPRLMTNEDNTPVWQWPYSAFGNNKPTGILKATPNPKAAMTHQPVLLKATNATELNLRFPGQYADEETGSFYNYFRTYSPNNGRYTQSDPIGLAGGLNRFAYAEGYPLANVDPLGLWSFSITAYIPAIGPIGPGGGMTFGTNPNGTGFMTFKFGIGMGGGWKIDPDGKRPGYDESAGCGWGAGYSLYTQADANWRSAYGQLSATRGVNSSPSGPQFFRSQGASAGMRGRISGYGVTAAMGTQVTVFGGGEGAVNGCTCK